MRFVLAAIAGLCLSPPAYGVMTDAPPAPSSRIEVETVAGGLVHPWALQFLPDGRMLVTERPGRMRIIDTVGNLSGPVAGTPDVVARGQGGLLDVALSPDFASSRTIFFTFSEPRQGGRNGTSVARARLVEESGRARLEGLRIIFRQEPAFAGDVHFGSRIAIAPDGRLFVTLGERFQMAFAQDLSRHWGKVVRINPDGSVPADNPLVGRADARPEIWSFGHRNPQAAAIRPGTGELWVVEHGPRGGDEVNIARPGRNYGWPVISYGHHYSGEEIPHVRAGMEQPLYYWDPSIAPSGMTFYTSERAPGWNGSLFVGALAHRHLSRLVLDGAEVKAEERLLSDLGERIRDVRQGPDGALYVLTDSANGRVIRVAPLGLD